MQASQEFRKGARSTVLVAVLLSAMLLSGTAGYLVRGGLPQSPAPAAVTDTAPSSSGNQWPLWPVEGSAEGNMLEEGRVADSECNLSVVGFDSC
jgi:hypothetical protein